MPKYYARIEDLHAEPTPYHYRDSAVRIRMSPLLRRALDMFARDAVKRQGGELKEPTISLLMYQFAFAQMQGLGYIDRALAELRDESKANRAAVKKAATKDEPGA